MKRNIILCFVFVLASFLFAEGLENALVNAVNNEDYDAVVSLLNSGANPNGDISNPHLITPLGLACNKGNINIVRILLKNGADPNYKPKDNSSPYLFTVFGRQKAEIMQLLIDYGLKVNYVEPGQDHYAFGVVTLGHPKTLRVLIDAGLNINIKNKEGYTLTEWAKKTGHKECIDLLERKPFEESSDEEVILTNYDKLYYHMTHSINDNSENTIYTSESIFISKGTLKVITQGPYYSMKRYLVQFNTLSYSFPFIIEIGINENLNVNYDRYINQDLRICLSGYGTYIDNGIEIKTYKFCIDTRKVKKNLIEQNENLKKSNHIETPTSIETETNISNNKADSKNLLNRDYINFSILGGVSLNAIPVVDLNLKLLINKYMFIVIQGGTTAVNNVSQKISSKSMLSERTIGFGGYVKPIKAYKMNIFGYVSGGLVHNELKGGYIKNGIYTDSSFYFMLRACAGIDFPISQNFTMSVQDCFDYLFNLGFTDSINAGITIKI